MSEPPLVVRTTAIDDPGDLLGLVPADPSKVVWLRAGEGEEDAGPREGLVGWGEAARVEVAPGPDHIARASAALTALFADADVTDAVERPGTGPVAVGSFPFDPASPGTALLVPAVTVGRRDGRAWVTLAGRGGLPLEPDLAGQAAPPPPDRVRYAGTSTADTRWLEAVADALERIAAGRLEKVVLARDHAVWAHAPFDTRALAARLSARFPGCFVFCCDGLVGATPELLVRRTGDDVASLVLAGTAGRKADPAADANAGEALLASTKDHAEHTPAVTSVVNGLAGICQELQADESPSLLGLDNVWHLATRVTARLTQPATALELAARLHPSAAVGGAPTDEALTTIRELERMDRGRYAGPVGWVDARGDGEWGIALRCAQVSGTRARLFAGAGIVAGSLPEAELEETRLKLAAMRSAFQQPR